jgi:stage II sporulation protein AB (anti-sigma F factor)
VGIADLEQARAPLYTTGGAERAGMGFTIMESFTDHMKVRSTPGKGTTVVLTKKISRRMGGAR